jgi:hypothetical protein
VLPERELREMSTSRSSNRSILIEGITPEQILTLPDDYMDQCVLAGEPLVLRAGSAQILGEFRRTASRLTVELAQIEGGGEGVLPILWLLVDRYSKQRGFGEVEWIVHAVNCAHPNLKLRRVLERRGFEVRTLDGKARVYYKLIKHGGV